MKKIGTLLALASLWSFMVHAQLSETYYVDMVPKEGNTVSNHLKGKDYIVISGSNFSQRRQHPSVSKIDTNGNVIWKTTDHDTAYYEADMSANLLVMDANEDIYTSLDRTYRAETWKVDGSTGEIVWRVNVGGLVQHIIDYNSDHILVGFYKSCKSNPCELSVALINKKTGTFSSFVLLTNTYREFGLGVDEFENIYVGYQGEVSKFSAAKPDSLLKTVSVPSLNRVYKCISTRQFGLVFIASKTSDVSSVVSVDPATMTVNWDYATKRNYNAEYQAHAITDEYLHLTLRHTSVGSTGADFWCIKVDMSNGQEAWDSRQNVIPLHTGLRGGASAMSVDVDSKGDVYMTGYYGADNYGPETWGIAKVNGADGKRLYFQTITLDSLGYDEEAVGNVAVVFKDRPMFLGQLETSGGNYPKWVLSFVKIDPNTGIYNYQKYYYGDFQFPSKTIKIQQIGNGRVAVYKQLGRAVAIAVYKGDKLLWQKEIDHIDYVKRAHDMIYTYDDRLAFVCRDRKFNRTTYGPPYNEGQMDSFHLYVIDTNGQNLIKSSVEAKSRSLEEFRLINDHTRLLLQYDWLSTRYLRVFENNTLGGERIFSNFNNDNPMGNQSIISDGPDHMAIITRYSFPSGKITLDRRKRSDFTGFGTAVEVSWMEEVSYIWREPNSGHILLAGTDDRKYARLVLCNLEREDTLWSMTFDRYESVHRFVVNIDSNHLYTIGQYNDNLRVRKVDLATHKNLWTRDYVEPSSIKAVAKDAHFHRTTNELVLVGHQMDSFSGRLQNNVFIWLLSDDGNNSKTVVKRGALRTDNEALCIEPVDDVLWIGGDLSTTNDGYAGFIFKVDSRLYTSLDHTGHVELSELTAFPNPAQHGVSLEWQQVSQGTAHLTIYNATGKQVWITRANGLPGRNQISTDLSHLKAGVYYVQLQYNDVAETIRLMKQ